MIAMGGGAAHPRVTLAGERDLADWVCWLAVFVCAGNEAGLLWRARLRGLLNQPRIASGSESSCSRVVASEQSFVRCRLGPVVILGVPWRDLPDRFGDWKNVHRRFSGWAE